MKIRLENPNLGKIGQKYRALYMNTYVQSSQRHKITIKELLITMRKRNNTKRTHCRVCIVDSDVGISRILRERTVAEKVTLYQAYSTVEAT